MDQSLGQLFKFRVIYRGGRLKPVRLRGPCMSQSSGLASCGDGNQHHRVGGPYKARDRLSQSLGAQGPDSGCQWSCAPSKSSRGGGVFPALPSVRAAPSLKFSLLLCVLSLPGGHLFLDLGSSWIIQDYLARRSLS